nr:unnamed protein product [Digitaria exilis]
MDAAAALGAAPGPGAPPPGAAAGEQQAAPRVERLSAGVQQQLNLEGMRARAVGLYKAISRILEDFDVIARTNPAASPKWQDVLGQFSMVSMELFNIVEDIKNVSKVFVVYPRNVNAENAPILPVMLSSKLLPEMEAEETTKREQLLSGITNLPVPTQIEKIKVRIDMIGSACETAEKVIAECRKTYGLGTRQGTNIVPTLDKAQAAKIQEQENLLRAAVNYGEGLRVPGDQRQPQSLPCHLVEVLPFGDGTQNFGDNSGTQILLVYLSYLNVNDRGYPKNPSTFTPSSVNTQGNPIQMANMPGTMQSQSLMPQMQYGMAGGHQQRSHPSQMLTDQMFGMGATNSSMMGMQQQQQQQGVYGNMQAGAQNMQQGMVGLQNQAQNPNFPQQRQQN